MLDRSKVELAMNGPEEAAKACRHKKEEKTGEGYRENGLPLHDAHWTP
jgi:hypothetical protein